MFHPDFTTFDVGAAYAGGKCIVPSFNRAVLTCLSCWPLGLYSCWCSSINP